MYIYTYILMFMHTFINLLYLVIPILLIISLFFKSPNKRSSNMNILNNSIHVNECYILCIYFFQSFIIYLCNIRFVKKGVNILDTFRPNYFGIYHNYPSLYEARNLNLILFLCFQF